MATNRSFPHMLNQKGVSDVPFKSEQQQKWAFATKQPFAKEWAKKTDQKSLPQKVSGKKESAWMKVK